MHGSPTNSSSTPTPIEPPASSDFFSNILTPGSSIHPTFQICVDAAFSLLLVVLVTLFFLTKGNLHLVALIGIEGCLWASVKWYVKELQKVQVATDSRCEDSAKEKDE